jgi:phosphohistidine phosphatase
MKTLYLLRHAKSSRDDLALSDRERALSKRGARASRAIGRYMRRHGWRPDHVLCSPARRTRETLNQVLEELGATPPVNLEEAVYLADRETLLECLRGVPERAQSLLVVGHDPGLSALALWLAGSGAALGRVAAKFPTGALAVIEIERAEWHSLVKGCGRLTAFITPRAL